MFDADHPIENREQDRLGRALFGKYLARCILDHTHPDSLVIGLYGGPGTGKTSIINLTLEELRYATNNMFDNEKPIIMNFNPWGYSGQHELSYAFFRRLSAEMRHDEFFDNANIIQLMEWYVSFFSHQPLPKALRPEQPWITKLFQPEYWQEDNMGWESGRDLFFVKNELNDLLEKQKHKLIIFIDNISRLNKHEIEEIFQIVKSSGDFSNTIYILAMDKEQLIKSDKEKALFIEKIVQLPFEIPLISKQDIETILLDRLHKIQETVPMDSWDKHYWADIYYSTLKYFFTNVRDVTRYINTLSFSYTHVKEVVNPVDFFAICAIQVFEPNVFYGIRDNKDLFIDLVDHVTHFNKEKWAEDKLRTDEIILRAERIPKELLIQLLIRLFPRLRSIYEANIHFNHSEIIARKNKRICSYDVFEIYFRLTIPNNDFSLTEMHAILALQSDEEGFALALLRLNQDDRISRFLDTLDGASILDVKTDQVNKVVNALMDSADLFPEGQSNHLGFDTASRIHRIFQQLLRRFPEHKTRFDIFMQAIKKSVNSIFIIVHELNEQITQPHENDDTFVPSEDKDFSPKELAQLKLATVVKIKEWAEPDRLTEHPKLIPILYAWKNWGDELECKQFVEEMIKSDRGLITFLGQALKQPVKEAMEKEERNPDWVTYLQQIEDFIPAKKILPHARELFEDDYFVKLREDEQLSLLIFLDLVQPDSVKIFPDTA